MLSADPNQTRNKYAITNWIQYHTTNHCVNYNNYNMSSSSSNVSPSSDSLGSSPNINIQSRSPSKVRLPSNLTDNSWTVVGPQQLTRARPAFNIDSLDEFPRLPPVSAKSGSRSPSPEAPSDEDDVFKGSVEVALR